MKTPLINASENNNLKLKNMWQKCPVCNGVGKVVNTLSSSTFDVCTICNGTKIISELSGLPPNFEQNKADRQKHLMPIEMANNLNIFPLQPADMEKPSEKIYTLDDLRKCFQMAKAYHPMIGYRFKTFEEFIEEYSKQ